MKPTGRKLRLLRTDITWLTQEIVECDVVAADNGCWYASYAPSYASIPIDALWAVEYGFAEGPVRVNGYEWRYAE